MKKRLVATALMATLLSMRIFAQDPSYSQFFSSPLNINPALTGQVEGNWRVISNLRRQWSGPVSPYNTGTISFDSKLFQNTDDYYQDQNGMLAIGGMMMYDETMGGALKSSYASLNFSGSIRIATGGNSFEENGMRIRHLNRAENDEGAEQRISAGLGFIYGNRRMDFSKLNFEDQFTGNGFDTNLPTGESALSNMKPYFSTAAGLLYSYTNANSHWDLGVSAYHFNKPRQSFLNDPNQYLAARYVIHSNLETILGNNFEIMANGVYQYQGGASYFSIGGALGYYVPASEDHDLLLRAGMWYWSKNAIIPYVGLRYDNFELGVSYDYTNSRLTQNALRVHTYELSLTLRGLGNAIPAPWR